MPQLLDRLTAFTVSGAWQAVPKTARPFSSGMPRKQGQRRPRSARPPRHEQVGEPFEVGEAHDARHARAALFVAPQLAVALAPAAARLGRDPEQAADAARHLVERPQARVAEVAAAVADDQQGRAAAEGARLACKKYLSIIWTMYMYTMRKSKKKRLSSINAAGGWLLSSSRWAKCGKIYPVLLSKRTGVTSIKLFKCL